MWVYEHLGHDTKGKSLSRNDKRLIKVIFLHEGHCINGIVVS